MVACVRLAMRNKLSHEVRRFATTTRGLLELADWLEASGVTQVAMEATGVYWKPVWHMLEERFQLVLANAAHVHNVPGRKSDVNDATWMLSRGVFLSGDLSDGNRVEHSCSCSSWHRTIRGVGACDSVAPRALDDLLGAPVAGAGDAGDRRRPVPHHLLARSVAVAAAARPRGGGARLRRHRARGRRALRHCARAAIADGLRRLDHASGLRHRPATALVDALAVMPSNSYSLVLWNAHVERARAAAQTFKAGWPSPRVAGRDPYALRAPGPEGPPGAQGPTGPAGGSGSAIHFLHVGCSTSSCTVSCKEGERILNAMAFTPGGQLNIRTSII